MQFDSTLTIDTADGVYPPSEDTMLLLGAVDVHARERILEIGTGTGVIALHAAKVAHVVATDVNPTAVSLVRKNALKNDLSLAVVRCDVFDGLRGTFDVIAFNPPYLEGDVVGGWDERAWRGGMKGIELTKRFLQGLPHHLTDRGHAYLLIRSDQIEALMLTKNTFDVKIVARRKLFFEELLVFELSRRTATNFNSSFEKGKETVK